MKQSWMTKMNYQVGRQKSAFDCPLGRYRNDFFNFSTNRMKAKIAYDRVCNVFIRNSLLVRPENCRHPEKYSLEVLKVVVLKKDLNIELHTD